MTAQKLFARSRRRLHLVTLACAAAFAGGFALGRAVPNHPAARPLWMGGLAVGFVGVLAAQFRWFRCPRCGANLANLLMRGRGYADPASVRFCPHCGADFTDELPGAPAVDSITP